jgi:hypothetical protein
MARDDDDGGGGEGEQKTHLKRADVHIIIIIRESKRDETTYKNAGKKFTFTTWHSTP